jgi:hypothetical protein
MASRSNGETVSENDPALHSFSVSRLNGSLDWNNPVPGLVGEREAVLVGIKDVGINFKKGKNARRLAAFVSKGPDVEMFIVEEFETKNNSTQRIFNSLSSFSTAQKVNSVEYAKDGGYIVLYDENYKRLSGNALVSRKAIKENKNESPHAGAPQQQANSGQCQTWGVFLVITDEFGNEIGSFLLYEFTTGDCTLALNAEQVPPDYGGSGQMNDIDAEIEREFSRATAFTSSPEYHENYDQSELVQGVITWIIGRGSGWHVEALTQFSYNRTPYRDVNTLQLVPVFNFSIYKTMNSRFVGFNMAVETTWEPSPYVDIIHYNNSDKAYGSSWVDGALRHKWKGALGSFPVPGRVGAAHNTLTFRPK